MGQICVKIILAVGEALQFLHEQRITHLDIKPDNIILSDELEPVIIDFGLARHYKKGGQLTHVRNMCGCTDGYSPKEQYVGIETFSPKSDTYALAATLLFMFTGERPPKAGQLNAEYIHGKLDGKCEGNIVDAIIAATQDDIDKRCGLDDFLTRLGGKESERTKTRIIVLKQSLVQRCMKWLQNHVTMIAVACAIVLTSVLGYKYRGRIAGFLPDRDTVTAVADTDTVVVPNTIIKDTIDTITVEQDTLVKDKDPETIPQPPVEPKWKKYAESWTGKTDANGDPDGEGTMVFKKSHSFGLESFEAGDRLEGEFKHGTIYYGKRYRNGEVKDMAPGN